MTTNWAEIDAKLNAEHAELIADGALRERCGAALPRLRERLLSQRSEVESLSAPEFMCWAPGGRAAYAREIGIETAIDTLARLVAKGAPGGCAGWLRRPDVDLALRIADEAL